ncbi:hypothetical protein [Gracilibacillus salinarum]|uniref:Uncharacterized protein n=1 Tax=Gracilibacillus salinarum TaxID=2932255 RepID=A0ABY4GL40_9BACI|nr:hypothetical protein [Gracilibacillus salinarum]UOQ84918.1 hypothetical protein MUN87_20070 [Gracilibacillus salinarum]
MGRMYISIASLFLLLSILPLTLVTLLDYENFSSYLSIVTLGATGSMSLIIPIGYSIISLIFSFFIKRTDIKLFLLIAGFIFLLVNIGMWYIGNFAFLEP